MKADRLLTILLLLQARGRLTGRELSLELEVSERTVHRDMEALSASGVPVFALRGSQGGWQLDQDWRTEVPGLSEAELRALLMAQPRTLGDPRLVAAAEGAFNKLMAALPGRMRQQAAAIRERLHVDATGWHVSGEDLSMLAAVQDAVANDRQLTFNYTRADGQNGPRTVDPLGLVAKGTTWYLVARAPNGLRTYRVSRMQTVTPLVTSFQRPEFDLAAFWMTSNAQLKEQRRRYDATLSLHPQAALSLNTWRAVTQAADNHDPGPEDWVTLHLQFEDEEQARFVVMGFGLKVQVLAPAALRERVLTEATAIAALYSSGKAQAALHRSPAALRTAKHL
jgi:predicted DNA-binding transcriptional regulator YafY